MWPLVAMENALFSDPSLDWERRCAVIAQAGFAGVYAVPYPLTDDHFDRLATLDRVPTRCGLRLAGVYANLDLAEPADSTAARRVHRLFETVAGVPRIELSFKHSGTTTREPGFDEAIIARLEPLLAIAERRGFDLVLYPHYGYPLETPDHARRIVQRIRHPRLGFLFTVSHAFSLWPPANVAAELRACAAQISSFNFCGCRRSAPQLPAKVTHCPLDEGDFDLKPLLAALAAGDYRGDVIVQGHGWQGDLPAMLRRSVMAYERFLHEID